MGRQEPSWYTQRADPSAYATHTEAYTTHVRHTNRIHTEAGTEKESCRQMGAVWGSTGRA